MLRKLAAAYWAQKRKTKKFIQIKKDRFEGDLFLFERELFSFKGLIGFINARFSFGFSAFAEVGAFNDIGKFVFTDDSDHVVEVRASFKMTVVCGDAGGKVHCNFFGIKIHFLLGDMKEVA